MFSAESRASYEHARSIVRILAVVMREQRTVGAMNGDEAVGRLTPEVLGHTHHLPHCLPRGKLLQIADSATSAEGFSSEGPQIYDGTIPTSSIELVSASDQATKV